MKAMKLVALLMFTLGSVLTQTSLGQTPNDDLIKACLAGNLTDVKAAVDKGADVNYSSQTGTPLSSSVMMGDVAQYLIEKGAKVNGGDYPPIGLACLYGSPEVIKAMLDAGADPNIPAKTDISASIQAALDAEKAKGKKANKAMIKAYEDMVVKMKASPVLTYPLTSLVTGTNCLDCMKMMVDKGAKTDLINSISGSTLFGDFATSGTSKKARGELNKVNSQYLGKYMAVADWFKNGDESKMATPDEIAKFLVSKGVDINLKNSLNNAPLMEALVVPPAFVQTEVILALINNGSDVKLESILYGKPMLVAAGNGQVEVLDALLAKGADINDEFSIDDKTTGQSLKGITLLMWAAGHDHLDAVKFLISKGVNLGEEAHGRSMNMKTKCFTKVEGKNAMYYAIETGNIEIVQALLDTKHYWGKAFVSKEMKHESTVGVLVLTTCFEIGGFIPSSYAKALGFPEIQKLLKAKLI